MIISTYNAKGPLIAINAILKYDILDEKRKILIQFMLYLILMGTPNSLTLIRMGGWIMPTVTLKACQVVWDKARGIKPSCNFHFGCLQQVDNINFGGCL